MKMPLKDPKMPLKDPKITTYCHECGLKYPNTRTYSQYIHSTRTVHCIYLYKNMAVEKKFALTKRGRYQEMQK